jgi:hypothetical protein
MTKQRIRNKGRKHGSSIYNKQQHVHQQKQQHGHQPKQQHGHQHGHQPKQQHVNQSKQYQPKQHQSPEVPKLKVPILAPEHDKPKIIQEVKHTPLPPPKYSIRQVFDSLVTSPRGRPPMLWGYKRSHVFIAAVLLIILLILVVGLYYFYIKRYRKLINSDTYTNTNTNTNTNMQHVEEGYINVLTEREILKNKLVKHINTLKEYGNISQSDVLERQAEIKKAEELLEFMTDINVIINNNEQSITKLNTTLNRLNSYMADKKQLQIHSDALLDKQIEVDALDTDKQQMNVEEAESQKRTAFETINAMIENMNAVTLEIKELEHDKKDIKVFEDRLASLKNKKQTYDTLYDSYKTYLKNLTVEETRLIGGIYYNQECGLVRYGPGKNQIICPRLYKFDKDRQELNYYYQGVFEDTDTLYMYFDINKPSGSHAGIGLNLSDSKNGSTTFIAHLQPAQNKTQGYALLGGFSPNKWLAVKILVYKLNESNYQYIVYYKHDGINSQYVESYRMTRTNNIDASMKMYLIHNQQSTNPTQIKNIRIQNFDS